MDTAQIKGEYFKEHLERGLQRILEKQREIAQLKVYGRPSLWKRSGTLMRTLESPKSSITISPDGGVEMETNLPVYIRFLDMKRNGNLGIYNRQIWGILYSDTLQNIKYEFRDWVSAHFPDMIEDIMKK